MTGVGDLGHLSRCLRLVVLGAVCLAVANCASGNMSRQAKRATIHYVINAYGNVVGGRPAGCPHSFCGCEASLYLFGHDRADLNLASNWARKFPRTAPAPGMAGVRNHHVFVLMRHVGGRNWLVHDGNSGHGLTREHVRSISGYTIVNPRAAPMHHRSPHRGPNDRTGTLSG
jgi:hypothetical protein